MSTNQESCTLSDFEPLDLDLHNAAADAMKALLEKKPDTCFCLYLFVPNGDGTTIEYLCNISKMDLLGSMKFWVGRENAGIN